MGLIKRFLFEHGEKLAFGVIALLCLWSVFGALMKDADTLELGDGKTYVVKAEDVEEDAKRIQSQLGKAAGSKEFPPVPNLPEVIDDYLARSDAAVPPANLEWLHYSQPLDLQARRWYWEPISEGPGGTDTEPVPPDPSFRTRIGAPINWSVTVGQAGILITCEDSPGINWPKDGTVKVALFRKVVGEGRETLARQTRESFLMRSAGEAVEVAAEDQEEGFGNIDFGAWGEGAEPEPEREFTTRTTTPKAAVISEFDWTVSTSLPQNADEFRSALLDQEKEVGDHIRTLTDPSTMVPTGWEVVTHDMPAYPMMPDTMKILQTGKLPVPMGADGGDAPPARPGPDRKTPAAGGDGFDIFGGTGGGADDGAREAAETVAEAEEGLIEAEPYEGRYYAFLDKNVDENTVYRYRLVTYLKVDDIPPEVRAKPEHQAYMPYVEMADMGERRFALTTTEFGSYVRGEMADKTVGALGLQKMPEKIKFLLNTKGDRTLNVAGLRVDGYAGPPTDRAASYLRDNAYSIFAYTDVVLTPVRRRISLVSAIDLKPDTNRYAEVTLKVEAIKDAEPEAGEDAAGEEDAGDAEAAAIRTKAKTYRMVPKEEVGKVSWQDFLVIGADGKVVYGDNNKPELKDLHRVYGPALKNVMLEEIGTDNEKFGRELWNFSTGWGLVDVRQCRVTVKRYRDPQRTEFKNRAEYNKPYVIIRELKPAKGHAPRYKRIIGRIPVGPDDIYTMDVDWEPQVVDKAFDAMKSRLYLDKADVADWKDFCSHLSAQGPEDKLTPARRVWELLTEQTQILIREGANAELPDNRKDEVLEALNRRIMENRTFYPSFGREIFPVVPEDVKRMLAVDRRSLSDLELLRLNRALMEAGFPNLIKKANE